MGIHELTTNAAKYGALSVPNGLLEISWDVATAEGGRTLQIHWIESGGPKVEKPGVRGFGSRLIERGLKLELNADVRVDFYPDGLRCLLRIPLD